jgi:hypothetical protein
VKNRYFSFFSSLFFFVLFRRCGEKYYRERLKEQWEEEHFGYGHEKNPPFYAGFFLARLPFMGVSGAAGT